MSSLFSPKMPAVQPPPPVPMVDQGTITREAQDLAMRRRGRAANVLAGDTGPAPSGSVAVKSLLGS
jgi:hypothetical protein